MDDGSTKKRSWRLKFWDAKAAKLAQFFTQDTPPIDRNRYNITHVGVGRRYHRMVDSQGPTERKNIWVAAGDGDLERVRELVNAGLSPTVADENSYTPLHAAASWGRLEVLRYLHSQGADMNTTDDDGDTPLFSVEDVETAKLVIELGGDPRHKNGEGKTAAENLAEDYPDVCNYLRSLVGQAPLERPTEEDMMEVEEAESDDDPANEMTHRLMEQVRAMMTDAEREGMDSNSTELDQRLRALVTKAVDESVGVGKLLASTTGAADQSSSSSSTPVYRAELGSVAEADEPSDEKSQETGVTDANKRQRN
ncbi:hypothetical protein PCANC_09075 [Puccinia coronata f. sp. avenae]|uniref:Uncharacterized protein n=2 Tax=Puccinia coronata f. sp. avenae TaxID=200324 RepID=A0A2N5SWW2_9BASI|nr:hypothetical protein PCANC_09075 [Puccinia coronata f. sp. avenae]